MLDIAHSILLSLLECQKKKKSVEQNINPRDRTQIQNAMNSYQSSSLQMAFILFNIQDEKFVMKKTTERASNFASYRKKKRQILHAWLVSLDKIPLPNRGKWPVRIKTNKTCIENLVYKCLVIAVGCKEETKCGNQNRKKRRRHNNRNQSCND